MSGRLAPRVRVVVDGRDPTACRAAQQAELSILQSCDQDELRETTSRDQLSPLHIAAALGHIPALDYILKNAGLDMIDQQDAFGRTALWLASANGKEDAVKRLLDAGANPLVSDELGETALHAAIARGWSGIVEKLLEVRRPPVPAPGPG